MDAPEDKMAPNSERETPVLNFKIKTPPKVVWTCITNHFWGVLGRKSGLRIFIFFYKSIVHKKSVIITVQNTIVILLTMIMVDAFEVLQRVLLCNLDSSPSPSMVRATAPNVC